MKPRTRWLFGIACLSLAGQGASAEPLDSSPPPKSEARLAAVSLPVPPKRSETSASCEVQNLDHARVRGLVLKIAADERIDPALAEAIAEVESGMGRNLASKAGAIGIMQLMPATGAAYGALDSCNPEANIRAGLRYLRDLLDEFGDPVPALAAYNAGPTKVYRHRGVPIQTETVAYIAKVLNRWRGYDRTLPKTRSGPIERSRVDGGTRAVRHISEGTDAPDTRPNATAGSARAERWVDAHVFIME